MPESSLASSPPVILAVDCGAESGRVIAGILHHDHVELDPLHRFANGGHQDGDYYVWDWDRILDGIRTGLEIASKKYPNALSIGVDTWGVDFGLIDKNNHLIHAPTHYRDPRGERGQDILDAHDSPADRFSSTGTQQFTYNTLNQLAAMAQEQPNLLGKAKQLLFCPDLLAWHLSGVAQTERSIASTSSCFHPGATTPHHTLLSRINVPRNLVQEARTSGKRLGPLANTFRDLRPSFAQLSVMSTAGHDTASAVAAIPHIPHNACFLSSGTWSIMGCVQDSPALSRDAFEAGLSNEVTHDGKYRVLKNIMGLWVIQQCKQAFAADGRSYDYSELTHLAEIAPAPSTPLDVNDPRFFGPSTSDDPMSRRVHAWYTEQSLEPLRTVGEIINAILHGLAQCYAESVRHIERVTGQPKDTLIIVGGGTQNAYLNQLTAHYAACSVIIGPVEATALGNIMVQAEGMNLINAHDKQRLLGHEFAQLSQQTA